MWPGDNKWLVTCQWALVHRAEEAWAKFGWRSWQGIASQEKNPRNHTTLGLLWVLFSLHYSPLASNHINHLVPELETARKLVGEQLWEAMASCQSKTLWTFWVSSQFPKALSFLLWAPGLASLFPSLCCHLLFPAELISSPGTMRGQKTASQRLVYLVHPNCHVWTAHHVPGVLLCALQHNTGQCFPSAWARHGG